MEINLQGRVALITGGSRGIGRALALAFAQAGARVVVASRKQESVDAVAEEIRAAGGSALALACHVGCEPDVRGLVAGAIEAFGGIDILVNNAATNPHFGPTLEAEPALWDKIMQVNLRGPFLLAREAAPHMLAGEGGCIINMASVTGLRPSALLGIYSVSKAALIMLTRVLALELGPQGIRVNAIAPGVIRTEFSRPLWESEPMRQRVLQATPLRAVGEVGDVVGAALYLASDLAAYVNGAVLTVDGGMSEAGVIG